MSKVNKVQLIGHLGSNPTLVTTNSGTVVLSVSLATHETSKASDGTKSQKVTWHNIVAFDKTAELLDKFTKKGSYIMLCGSLQTRQYLANSGENKFVTEIVVNEVLFLDQQKTDEGSTQK